MIEEAVTPSRLVTHYCVVRDLNMNIFEEFASELLENLEKCSLVIIQISRLYRVNNEFQINSLRPINVFLFIFKTVFQLEPEKCTLFC